MLQYRQKRKGEVIMSTKIGFNFSENTSDNETVIIENPKEENIPRKCLAEIRFPGVYKPYTYYNELFDLKVGDRVFVDGKLEGTMGIVVNISYNFKIKLSDYKCVIGKADTSVQGEFHFAGSHFVTFDPTALPYEKALTWFKAPELDEDYVSETDGSSFSLETLEGLVFNQTDLEKGGEIYMENGVEYIELNGTKGRAIVVTSKPYQVEFTYKNGEISELYCECYHVTPCKHCFATLMQLRDTVKFIEENYNEQYEKTNYFAAILKGKFFNLAIDSNKTGSINLK